MKIDLQVMASDIQIMSKKKYDQSLQLILKSWHKPIDRFPLLKGKTIKDGHENFEMKEFPS